MAHSLVQFANLNDICRKANLYPIVLTLVLLLLFLFVVILRKGDSLETYRMQ